MTDFRLYDDPGADVAEIVTDGATIKPFIRAVDAVVDECRLHVTADGLSVKAVDPANVFMGEVELNSDAFDTYDIQQDATLGVPTHQFKNLVRRARKGSGDKLHLSVSEMELSATVSRGYDNHNVVSQGTMDLIDPNSIRQEPDIPTLDRDAKMNVDADPFFDALDYGLGVSDYTKIAVKGVNQYGNALYIGGETDTRDESAAIDSINCADTAESIYSNDYLKDIRSALKRVDPDVITFVFGDEFPASFIAGTDNMNVEYLIAPRIQSGP